MNVHPYQEDAMADGGEKAMTDPPMLLTAREAAKSLAVCERTLFSRTKSGEVIMLAGRVKTATNVYIGNNIGYTPSVQAITP